MKKKNSKVYWIMDAKVLAELRGCQDFKENPAVFLTAKKITCCRLHWEKLADGLDSEGAELEVSKIEECVDFEETTKYPLSACCSIKVSKNEETAYFGID